MKKIYLFIFVIFFLGMVSCIDLTLSPSQMNFEGKTNERICRNLTVNVGQESELIGKTLWAKENITKRKLTLHNKTSNDLELEVYFEKELKISKEKNIPVCIEGKNPGNYHGAILYKIKDKPVQVGIWINLSLTKTKGVISITGNAVKEKTNNSKFVGFSLILALVLLSLFVISKTKEK